MKDRLGRTIEYMRVSVTDRCNLRCIYCMPENGVDCVRHEDILTFDEIVRICRIGTELGISRIKLTGGEPLVRRGLCDLLGMIKEIPGIEQVTLTTNGTLLRDKINELVSYGLDGVNISLDTLDPVRYKKLTRGGDLNCVLEALEGALGFPELRVRINCVPMPDTQPAELTELAVLARKYKTDVRFIELMPIGSGKKFHFVNGIDVYHILEEEFGRATQCHGKYGNGPAVYVRFSGFKGKIGFIDAVSHKFCDTCNRVRLTSEGYLKSCLQYETGVDLRNFLRRGASDAEIKKAMRSAVYNKPAGHRFSERPAECMLEKRDMSQIGG